LDVHVASAVDAVGGVLGVESFPTDERGYRRLIEWLRALGPVMLVGVEGTGSYGAGLTRSLQQVGLPVVEVDRPNRQARHRAGKSDPLDAIAAARAALSGTANGAPKSRTGNVEAIRVLMVARRSAVEERITTLNQLRHLCITAPEPIRRRFSAEGCSAGPSRSLQTSPGTTGSVSVSSLSRSPATADFGAAPSSSDPTGGGGTTSRVPGTLRALDSSVFDASAD
jgi:transposase